VNNKPIAWYKLKIMNNPKQHVIMFIGVDMCGKTNIAQELSRLTGIPYFKASEERLTFLTNQDKFLMDTRYADPRIADFLLQTGHNVIFDRGYPCEWVYSKFFERKTDEDVLKHIDSIHSTIGTKMIIPYRSSYDNVVDDIDPRLAGERLVKIENLYRDFSRWTGCQCFFLNVDSENLEKEISELNQFLNVL